MFKLITLVCTLFLWTNVMSKTITLTRRNSVILTGKIDSQSTSRIMGKLLLLDLIDSGDPIYLVLNSPGGSINSGLELVELTKGMRRPVHTIAVFAASMAFTLHQLLGIRYVFNFSTLMAHKAFGRFGGEFPGQIDSRYNFWKHKLRKIDRVIVARLKKYTVKQWEKMYENEYWVNGFDSIKGGFSDQKVSFRCDKDLMTIRVQSLTFFGLKFKVQWSNCPLITAPLSVKIGGNRKRVTIKEAREVIQKVKYMFDFKSWDIDEIKRINTFDYVPQN